MDNHDLDLLGNLTALPSMDMGGLPIPASLTAAASGPMRNRANNHRQHQAHPYTASAARERVGGMVSRTVPEQLVSLAAPTRPLPSLEHTTAVHAHLAKVQQEFVLESISSFLGSWLQDQSRFNNQFLTECERMGTECNKLNELAEQQQQAEQAAPEISRHDAEADASKQQCILYWEAGDEGVLYWNSADEGDGDEGGSTSPSGSVQGAEADTLLTQRSLVDDHIPPPGRASRGPPRSDHFATTAEGAAAVSAALAHATPQSPSRIHRPQAEGGVP